MSGVKSAERTLLVIELLTEHEKGLSFTDIMTELSLPKSSTHGLLNTMLDRSHLTFDETAKRYRLGVRLWEAGQAYERVFDLPSVGMPHLIAARDELNETVQLAVLDHLENIYVAKVEANQRLVLASEVGMRLPAYATGLGKALLAGLTDEEVMRRLDGTTLEAFTPSTLTSLDLLRAAIQQVRETGFALDIGEYTEGVCCVATPVRDGSGRTIAAMSVSVPEVRLGDGAIERIASVLQARSAELSRELGYSWSG